jgi:hypothetical protein
VLARWHPGIGDPTLVGWTTVVFYGVGALVAGRAAAIARRSQRQLFAVDRTAAKDQRAMKQLWTLTCIAMVVLGVNKQLDLQSLLIEKLRNRAYVDGWYSDRRRYQLDFILAVTVAATIGAIGLAVWLRRVLTRVALAIAGLAMLMLFVIIRAASFHYVDKVLALGDGLTINACLELSGIALVVAAALQWLSVERRRDTVRAELQHPSDDRLLSATDAIQSRSL